MSEKMIRILIADDHSIVRRGLKEILLDEFPDAQISEVNNGAELLQKARKETWNIIISDLSMPGRNGLETLKQLKVESPKIPVLILSMHPEDQYAIRVLRAGAAGYLTKESASDELVNAVRKILDGRRYITPSIAEKLAENLEHDLSKTLHETLSDREFDVLKLIASGKTVSEIADIFSLSVNTVSTYRARILEKMNMKTNAELTHYAINKKLV
jgi:two-component system, NarL family, invasion response regulator UvrY